MTERRGFSTWLLLMLSRLIAFLPTATPVILLVLNHLLETLGTAHATVGWQVEALAWSLLIGRGLREGLNSGAILKQLNSARAQMDAFNNSSHLAEPVGPCAPGAGIPWKQPTGGPPGVPVPPEPHLTGLELPRGY
jgi:hypothetical protein